MMIKEYNESIQKKQMHSKQAKIYYGKKKQLNVAI